MPWKAWIQDRRVQIGASVFLILLVALGSWVLHISQLVDQRLRSGVHTNTVNVYSAPKTVFPGMNFTPEDAIVALRRGGYRESGSERGTYRLSGNTIEISPSTTATAGSGPAKLEFEKSRLVRIVSLDKGTRLKEYRLEPELITNLAGDSRERRRLLRFSDIPPTFVHALLSAEDRKFFDHFGFDTPRLVKAVLVNLRSGRKEQGGSTLTMQLARNIWLDQGKRWGRKLTEMVIASLLEAKLSKEEIFEHYVNEVYLGNAGSFEIHGFGEASWRYFNRDLARLSLSQSALLAGVVQRPNYFDPIRHPERAIARRNSILGLMVRNGYITQAQAEQAQAEQIGADPRGFDGGEAPYFVDLALDEAFKRLSEGGGRTSLQVYTSLDPDLQQYATEAVKIGMAKVDALVAKKHKESASLAAAQAALVALDPKTGEVRAAVGGRNYSFSQLNRVLAKRQPGSAFKPFVYAAAMETQLGAKKVFTAASILLDEPTTFKFGDEYYEPANFGQTYNGEVTLRRALQKSLNVPTVMLAEEVGYKKVAELAKRAGITSELKGTPALALGSYVVTPLEIAGAYTVFANQGIYTAPGFVDSIRRDKTILYERRPEQSKALDPRVAFLMVDLLQGVMQNGTAGGVWSYGFRQPAAGKTGTSRDGWFAGFTSGLICVVWVGFDDNRDLDLEGAKSALPIWAEFMKRATQGGNYSGPLPSAPNGIVSATIDQDTGLLAGPLCQENTRNEYFIAGNEPKDVCTEPFAKSESNQPHQVIRESATALVADSKGMIGKALWYRKKGDASDEELIAAHPTFPAGTRLKVTNLGNRKSVIVRIEGRMVANNGTVISLNQKAADELDFRRYGFATVKLEMADKR